MYGREHVQLSDANVIWLKAHRDVDHFDWDYIHGIWLGRPPDPEEPLWLKDEFASRREMELAAARFSRRAIAELEGWGASARTINLFESLANLLWIDDLRRARDEDLLSVKGLGPKSLASLRAAVQRMDSGAPPADRPSLQSRIDHVQSQWSKEEQLQRMCADPPEWIVPEIPEPIVEERPFDD